MPPRLAILIASQLLGCALASNALAQADSILQLISPLVTVSATRIEIIDCQHQQTLDRAQARLNPTLSPLKLLNSQAGVALRQNGSGGISTFRYRGQSSNKLDITWLGLDVSDPQLGGFDVSTLDPLSNQVRLQAGGQTGGQLNLVPLDYTQPVVVGEYAQGAGYAVGAGVLIKKGQIVGFARRDFFDFDHAPELGRYNDGTSLQHEMLQATRRDTFNTFSLSSAAYVAHVSRKLANSRFGDIRSPRLKDLETRVTTAAALTDIPLTVQLAYLARYRKYDDSERAIRTEGSTHQFVTKLAYRLSPKLNLHTEQRLLKSSNDGYTGVAAFHRSESAVAGSFGALGGTLNLTAGLATHQLQGALPIGSARFTSATSRLKSINYSVLMQRTARFAQLDDLLWLEGGNQDIAPEAGWALNADLDLSQIVSVSLFARTVDNYILWLPGLPFWTPSNAGRVNTVGTAVSATVRATAGKSKFLATANATAVRNEALDLASSRLPFDPAFLGSLLTEWRINNTTVQAVLNAQSQQNTTYSTGEQLPASAELRLSVAHQFRSVLVNLQAENLLNADLPNADGFPMPKRRVSLNFQVNL